MNEFKIRAIDKFSQKSIAECFPPSFVHLNLADAINGNRQPDNAAVVGVFQKSFRGDQGIKQGSLIRLVMLEIEEGNPGISFEALIYGKYVPLIEELLRRVGNATPWIIFYDTYFAKFTGMNSSWSDITLKIDEEDNFNPGITFVLKISDLDKSDITKQEIDHLLNNSINQSVTKPFNRLPFHTKTPNTNKATSVSPSISDTKSPNKNRVANVPPSIPDTANLFQESISTEIPIAAASRLSKASPNKTQKKTSNFELAKAIPGPSGLVASSPQKNLSRNAAVKETSSGSANQPPKKVNLNSVSDGCNYTLFAVVKEVLKQTSVLPNRNRHTILLLTDPSCLEPDATREDLLLHIFFNKPEECFEKPIETSDILRLENMKGSYYQRENKVHGNIFSSQALVQYKFNKSDVIAITTNTNYKLTDTDKESVLNLKKWWDKANITVVTLEVELPLKTIAAVEGSSLFNISCVVTNIKLVADFDEIVLVVKDGTMAIIHTASFDYDETSQKFIPVMNKIKFGAFEIEISIFGLLNEEATRLKVGDFVFLTHVGCYECEAEKTTTKVFAFRMNSVEATITRVLPQSSKAQRIKRAISEKCPSTSTPKKRR